MKKLVFCILISLLATGKSLACGDYDPDEGYFYNLFVQEIIDDPQYYSFLLSYGGRYYSSGEEKTVPNENIEEWQKYIGLSYEDTYYLVFKATREEIEKLIDGKPVADAKLKFANAAWVRKNKQALIYLAYAKYLEPYMSVPIADEWYYGETKSQSVADLDYTKVMNALEKSRKAKSPDEINDAYLLLGFLSFSDPLPEMEKITASTPDAIQAKVLMARTINLIERTYNLSYANWSDNCIGKDKRYPLTCLGNEETGRFFLRVLDFSQEMANRTELKDKDFWNLTASYLHFINKDFAKAQSFLEKVEEKNAKYKNQKQNLAMYIDISEQAKITDETETAFYTKYQNVFNHQPGDYRAGTDADPSNVSGFVIDVLANRYFLQKDYAKSFLLTNNITRLENNPNEEILTALEAFYHQPDKNAMEKYMVQNLLPEGVKNTDDVQQYIDYLWGNIYLAKGELEKSLNAFKKIKNDGYRGFNGISNQIFGYNRIECFNCSAEEVMQTDYLSEFPFIKSTMNRKELTEALLQLQKAGQKNNETGAKANYLTGNFFYNASRTGYYRHILRFDQTNGAHYIKFDSYGKPQDLYAGIYFKDCPTYYPNQATLSAGYLEKAYAQAGDNELKARIAFALSKCEQEVYYDTNEMTPYDWGDSDNKVLILDRKYFA